MENNSWNGVLTWKAFSFGDTCGCEVCEVLSTSYILITHYTGHWDSSKVRVRWSSPRRPLTAFRCFTWEAGGPGRRNHVHNINQSRLEIFTNKATIISYMYVCLGFAISAAILWSKRIVLHSTSVLIFPLDRWYLECSEYQWPLACPSHKVLSTRLRTWFHLPGPPVFRVKQQKLGVTWEQGQLSPYDNSIG